MLPTSQFLDFVFKISKVGAEAVHSGSVFLFVLNLGYFLVNNYLAGKNFVEHFSCLFIHWLFFVGETSKLAIKAVHSIGVAAFFIQP